MKRMKANNERFKEEMRQRAEEAKKKKIEERAKEKERKKEEKKLVTELLNEWRKPRDDLECDDLKELPKTAPVHCKIPNRLFGDFLTLLEFFHGFANILETKDTFSDGITFDFLQRALTDSDSPRGGLYELLKFMLQALFDLQQEEDEEVKLDAKNLANVNIHDLDKNILGKDEDIANQIKSATKMARWCIKHQGQPIKSLHLDEFSITEILRLHIESSGAYRSDKSLLWLYQQRGGYKLSDDPGLQFRMDEPQILEALTNKTVYELSIDDKMKILMCLMQQVLSYASVRDEIDEKFMELSDAKYELRTHQIAENKRIKQLEEAEKAKRREERIAKKEGELKKDENKTEEAKDEVKKEPTKKEDDEADVAHLTERQREAIRAQKEKENKEKQKQEDIKRSEAFVKERELIERIAELQMKAGPQCLGRDRAYRRYWVLESMPGVYVEHDDDLVGTCLPNPTVINPNSKPIDENSALEKAKEILDAREKSSESQGSDKENDQDEAQKKSDVKTYSKQKSTLGVQKVLSTKNGTLQMSASQTANQEQQQPSGTSSEALEVKTEPVGMVNGTTEHIKMETDIESDVKPVSTTMWGVCVHPQEVCTVHSTILPKTYWSYISNPDDLDLFIEALNSRGFRESELKEKLSNERETLVKNLKKFNVDVERKLQIKVKSEANDNADDDDSMEDRMEVDSAEEAAASSTAKTTTRGDATDLFTIVELALRDQILELEERLFFGTLGSLKIRDRQAWQSALQNGSYDMQCDGLSWGGKSMVNTPFESRMVSATASREQSRPGSPDSNQRDSGGSFVKRQNKKVYELASAILQVAQMCEAKYFKQPLGKR